MCTESKLIKATLDDKKVNQNDGDFTSYLGLLLVQNYLGMKKPTTESKLIKATLDNKKVSQNDGDFTSYLTVGKKGTKKKFWISDFTGFCCPSEFSGL